MPTSTVLDSDYLQYHELIVQICAFFPNVTTIDLMSALDALRLKNNKNGQSNSTNTAMSWLTIKPKTVAK